MPAKLGAPVHLARAALLGALALAAHAATVVQARNIEPTDLQKIVNVSSPKISPDGESVAIIVSRVNWNEDRYDSELVLVDIATGRQRRLTGVRAGLSSPQWSPSGDRVAFLADAGEGKSASQQIFVIPTKGDEPLRITSAPMGVGQFAWRPDGSALAFITPDEPPNKAEIDHHHDLFEVGDNDFLATSAPTSLHLWLVPAKGGPAKRLTSGTWSLPSRPDDYPAVPLSWSPDGKQISITQQSDPHFGELDQTVVAILDVDSGRIRQLTKRTSFESSGAFSPDGSKIAYWFPRDGDSNDETEIFVASAAGGEGKDVTRALDRDVQAVFWMPDGKSLLLSGDDGVRRALWIQPLDGKAKKIELGEAMPYWDFSVDVGKNGAIAFTGTAPTQPAELYYLASPDAKPRRLTDFNREIATLNLGGVRPFEWQGPEGFTTNGILVYPPGFSPEKKYPLVIYLHGAPQFVTFTVEFEFLLQLLASHGYVVFAPNYIGCDNLGSKFELAAVNDFADVRGHNLMAGISALERQGFIDESRIGISGLSSGGYMTTWMIGHYHIWKAAVSAAAWSNLLDVYNLADEGVADRWVIGGSPWKKEFAKAYEALSPMTYADRITTPTLILHATGDPRAPIASSYELYHALKDNGVPVKFIALPIPGHEPDAFPVHRSDEYRYWVAWFDQYLK